ATIDAYYGANAIANSRFGDVHGTAGWVAEGGALIAASGGKLELTQVGGQTQARVTTSFPTVPGQWYRLSVDFQKGVNGRPARSFLQGGATTIKTIDYDNNGT